MIAPVRLRTVALALSAATSIAVVGASGAFFTGRPGPVSSSMSARDRTSPATRETATRVPDPSGSTVLLATSEPALPPAPVEPVAAPAEPTPAPVDPSPEWGCAAALAYLRAHANPAFALECPGNAFGRQAMTCSFMPGYCSDRQVIAIAVPCAAAYMNEAENSWVVLELRPGPLDPYGYCH